MKKKILITGAVVLVAAAVILGFILKNQVRENTDSTAVNVDIGQWDTMNRRITGIPTTMQLQRAWAAIILFRQQTEFQK